MSTQPLAARDDDLASDPDAVALPATDLGASAPPPGPTSSLRRTFASLSNRDFRYLTISSIATGFGQWGQQIALSWLVFLLTGSAAQLGGVAFVGGILSLILTPIGGIFADRYSRRGIIAIATFTGALQSAVLAVLVITDLVEVWHVYVFAVLTALTTSLNEPARQAYVFDVSTEDTLANAVAMNSIAQNISRITGPPLAGVLAAISMGLVFGFVVVVRGVATLSTMMMGPGRGVRSGAVRNPLTEIFAGFRYIGGDRRLLGLLVVTALPALFIYPYVSFMPLFASRVLHSGSAGYGTLLAAIGVGSIVGLLLLAYFGDVRRRGLLMLVGYIGYTGLVTVFTQSHVFWLSFGILVTAGVFFGFATALNTTIFLLLMRGDMRGRGMAAWQMAGGVSPITALAMGFAITRFGPQTGTAMFTATCVMCFLLITVFWRELREI